MSTKHAPAERENLEQVLKSSASLNGILYMKDILKSFSLIVFVLNEKRQIVFANDVFLDSLGLTQSDFNLGDRPGEVFGCVNAHKEPGGCGTSESCRMCGAVNVVLRSQHSGKKEVTETAITIHDKQFTRQLDLEITATPFLHDNKQYSIVSMVDITGKKKEQALERIFFHDIINIAGSLHGVLEIFNYLDTKEQEEYIEIASNLSGQIIEEIKAQRQMKLAEKGELEVTSEDIILSEFLNKLAQQIKFHQVAEGKSIKLDINEEQVIINSDPVLLTRVVINMLKNALEAIAVGEEVVLGTKVILDRIRLFVKNRAVIPLHVQLQIFQRSFSTKGKGRGLGTYSMKLIGERYLGAKVNFTSNDENGTIFYIDLPIK